VSVEVFGQLVGRQLGGGCLPHRRRAAHHPTIRRGRGRRWRYPSWPPGAVCATGSKCWTLLGL